MSGAYRWAWQTFAKIAPASFIWCSLRPAFRLTLQRLRLAPFRSRWNLKLIWP